MNILLTNDDGYFAPGIKLIYNCLQKYGNVVIVAPNVQNSAKSVSKTLGKPLKVEKIENNVFSCSGTPADCVAFGLNSLSIKFDLVVSGCNDGWNISYDTLYSGTVGAALEALINHVPSIAISSDRDLPIVEQYFEMMWEYINKHNLISDEYLLNINFPKEDVIDIKLGELYVRHDEHFFMNENDGYYAYRNCEDKFTDKNSDVYQVTHKIISIVPLAKTCFNQDIYRRLKNKIKEK